MGLAGDSIRSATAPRPFQKIGASSRPSHLRVPLRNHVHVLPPRGGIWIAGRSASRAPPGKGVLMHRLCPQPLQELSNQSIPGPLPGFKVCAGAAPALSGSSSVPDPTSVIEHRKEGSPLGSAEHDDAQGIEMGMEMESNQLGVEEDLANIDDWEEEELDDLFDKFGETIFDSTEGSSGLESLRAELQGSSEGLAGATASSDSTDEDGSARLALALAAAAADTKAGAIRVLDVRPLVYWTQYFVIATAYSRPQMDALAAKLSRVAEDEHGRSLRGGQRVVPSPWTLMDYGDVVVHLFAPKERESYAIEDYYANAQEVLIPAD